ncbi:Gfo/Idh/MocA family oxidoreductase [Paraburkholderia sp. SIMBA_049]
MENIKPLRFGVLGAAKIARSFIAGVAPSSLVDVVAVASRDLEKGKRFASELNVARVHGSYEALLDDPGIDAVYVPLPNTLHAEWVIKALDAGKHVLCEKPIAVSKVSDPLSPPLCVVDRRVDSWSEYAANQFWEGGIRQGTSAS